VADRLPEAMDFISAVNSIFIPFSLVGIVLAKITPDYRV